MTGSFELVGPFEHYDVVVRGRKVPYLEAAPIPGGQVDVSLDRRIALVLTVQEAEYLLPFIADCIAVGMGYTGHPEQGADPIPRPPMPRMIGLSEPQP